MYKVRRDILIKITRLLDKIGKPTPDGKGDLMNILEAQELSKKIKDNYTQIKP